MKPFQFFIRLRPLPRGGYMVMSVDGPKAKDVPRGAAHKTINGKRYMDTAYKNDSQRSITMFREGSLESLNAGDIITCEDLEHWLKYLKVFEDKYLAADLKIGEVNKEITEWMNDRLINIENKVTIQRNERMTVGYNALIEKKDEEIKELCKNADEREKYIIWVDEQRKKDIETIQNDAQIINDLKEDLSKQAGYVAWLERVLYPSNKTDGYHNLIEKIDTLEARNEDLKRENTELSDRIDSLRSAIKEKNRDIGEQQTRIEKFEKRIDEYQTREKNLMVQETARKPNIKKLISAVREYLNTEDLEYLLEEE